MLIPLALPPGVIKNGTPYQRRGRWVDSNLIRWYNGAVRPIGGWTRRVDSTNVLIPPLIADASIEAVRDTHSWRSLSQDQNVVLGSNLKLYHLSQLGVVTNITPAGMITTGKDASFQAGYGQNPYSVGIYGAANNLVGAEPTPPRRWTFDNFGEILLAQQRNTGSMYELNLTTLTTSVVTNAPTGSQDIVVTDQRIVMTIGSNGQPRLVKWSDQEDRNTWAAALDNQAGDITLQGTGNLLRCIEVLEQVLIVGETDAFAARYVGPPYIYSFALAARNCGLLAADALVGTERFAVWWGEGKFWLFDGSIQQLQCDVMEFLIKDLNIGQASKTSGFTNQQYSEVWWLYQSSAGTEVDSYVVWNYQDNTWATGRIDRTVGIDMGTLTSPLWVSSAGELFNHEQLGVMADGDVFVTSGAIDLEGGDRNMAVRYIYPDTEAAGDVQFTIYGKQFPSDTIYSYGPYTYLNPTPTRALGREVAFRFDLLSLGAEVGIMRAEVAPVGTGKR